MEKLKLAVIGTGLAWEQLHYPAIERLRDKFEIIALCNKTPEKATAFADKMNLSKENVYTDYRKMLEREDIDVVDILVPISENYEVAKDCILANKNIIAEKPFASTAAAAEELIRLANEKNVTVLVAENIRYDEESFIIKELLTQSIVGEPLYFIFNTACDFRNDMIGKDFGRKEWRQHPAFEGGIFLDGGIHDIARMRFLFGDVDKVYAIGRPCDNDYSPFITINALLHFNIGITGHYAFFTDNKELTKSNIGFRIICTRGEIYLESKDCENVVVTHADGIAENRKFTKAQGYYYELENYYDAVMSGKPIVSTPEKELGDIKLVFEILEKARMNVI